MTKPTYTKAQKLKIDKRLRESSQDELRDLEQQGAQILRDRQRNKQREYNARYRQRVAMAAQMGLIDRGDE